MTVSMRRIADSPCDQDADALKKLAGIGEDKDKCSICGGPNGTIWLHCDSWTKWLRFGCGCNVMHCENCKDAAHAKSRELIAANRKKAEEAEINQLKNIEPGQLARLRYRYFDDFNCSDEFREWVKSVVGEDRMKEMLDVPCTCCGKLLGQPKYTFEDKDGNRHLWTLDEIETYCYQVMGRDPATEPFVTQRDTMSDDFRVGGMDKAEIGFQSPIWDYYERQGWEHNDHDKPYHYERFHKAFDATKGADCGGDNFWSYGYFIYHLPTKTFLGKMAKRGGDWPQVVQINRKQLDEERDALRTQYGEKYHENPDFWPAYKAIEQKQEWVYYCGKECCQKSSSEQGTMFI